MADPTLPTLATATVGSYARPSWLVAGLAASARGEFGPADLREMLDDAVDLALRDQAEAGIDLPTDGEMRRAGFFTAEFYQHLTGRHLSRTGGWAPSGTTSNTGSRCSSRSRAQMGSASSPNTRSPGPARTGHSRSRSWPVYAVGRLVDRLRLSGPDRGRLGVRPPGQCGGAGTRGRRGPTLSRSTSRRRPSIPTRRRTSPSCSTRGSRGSVPTSGSPPTCASATRWHGRSPADLRPVLAQVLRFEVAELVLEEANREMAELDRLPRSRRRAATWRSA